MKTLRDKSVISIGRETAVFPRAIGEIVSALKVYSLCASGMAVKFENNSVIIKGTISRNKWPCLGRTIADNCSKTLQPCDLVLSNLLTIAYRPMPYEQLCHQGKISIELYCGQNDKVKYW